MYINYSKNFYTKSKQLTDFLNSNYDAMFYIGHEDLDIVENQIIIVLM